MKEREEKEELPQKKDRHLDIPSEANRDKHINFLEAEEESGRTMDNDTDSPFFIPNNAPLKRGNNQNE